MADLNDLLTGSAPQQTSEPREETNLGKNNDIIGRF